MPWTLTSLPDGSPAQTLPRTSGAGFAQSSQAMIADPPRKLQLIWVCGSKWVESTAALRAMDNA